MCTIATVIYTGYANGLGKYRRFFIAYFCYLPKPENFTYTPRPFRKKGGGAGGGVVK